MSCLNHEHRHYFVHVPKAAGTSMERMAFVGGHSHETARSLARRSPPGYWGWGFVRDPRDRLVAVFHAAQQHGRPRYGSMGFAQWCAALPASGAGLIHTCPMVDFLCWPDGRLAVDFVGRFERLDEDWRRVCRRLGVEYQALPHRTASSHRPWQEYFTEGLAAHVARVYAADFSTFGYATAIEWTAAPR